MLSFAQVLIGLLVISLASFESSLYILDIRPLSDMWFADIFSQSVVYLFIFFTGSFEEQTFYILMRSNSSSFPFLGHVFGVKSKTSLPSPRS